MNSLAEILINALIDKCKNVDTQKGLKAALSIIENSGYINIYDLEKMDEDEIYQEALGLSNLNEENSVITKQKEFDKLYKKYGFNNPDITRNTLSKDEERKFVNDCFETYEHIGFAKTFGTPYTGEEQYVGMKFTVLCRVKEITEDKENGAYLECLPMWNIQLENGDIMAAYPEEICLAERK